ncbi:MAG: hypothetical protein NTZ05_12410 [Chloroflexi bacterium]|nr:hypothetical protein [Chloroflexota bacterium]
MKLIRAVELPGRGLYEFVAWLDEERAIPDPAAPEPEDGAEDTRERLPDPAWCASRVWQIEPHAAFSDEAYVAAVVAHLAKTEWAPELERRKAEAGKPPEAPNADQPVKLALEGMAL